MMIQKRNINLAKLCIMKKHLLLFAAFCAAVLVSCTPKELIPDTPAENPGEQVAPEMVTLTITARLDGTKAYIDDEDNHTWKWADGDQLAVYDAANTKQVLNLTGGADTAVATFSAEVPAGFVPVNGVFPASAAGATAEEYSIPALQTIPAGKSIDPEALVATATSDNGTDFNFTSAVSFLRVTAGNDVARVIIHTNNDPEATMTGASSSVTAVAPASGSYWIAVKPGVYNGIRVFTRTADQVTAGTGRFVSGSTDLDLATPGQGRKLGTLGASDKGTVVYVIETGQDLNAFLGGTDAKDAYVVNDLDLTGLEVTARASYSNNFDGQYHSISNWTSDGQSLFGTLKGSLQNTVICDNCSITVPSGDFGIFGKVLESTGSIKNCQNYASVTIPLGDGTVQYRERQRDLGASRDRARKSFRRIYDHQAAPGLQQGDDRRLSHEKGHCLQDRRDESYRGIQQEQDPEHRAPDP